jgi:hypothetical protein
MSLHKLATEIQKKGRGDDTMLMHVTPSEVKGLQAIAKAHGGSLTINPDTGLVEAGFLKNIMPMIVGAGLTAATGGAAAPWMIGLGYGGFEAARTGDISKGLMAGLGAYGGAGLAGGLASAGAGAAEAAVPEATKAVAAESAGTMGNQFAYNAAGEMVPANVAPSITGAAQGTAQVAAPGASAPSYLSKMGSGVGQLGTEAGRSAVYSALPTGTLPAAGMSVAAGALEPKNNVPGEEEYKRRYPELSLADDFRGYTPTRPNPYYTPRGLGYGGYAQGGTVGFQDMPNGGLAALQGMRDGYGAMMTAGGDVAQFQAGGDIKKKKATRTSAAQLAGMSAGEAGLAELNNARAMAQMGGGNFALPKRSVEDMGVISAAKGRYLKGGGDGMSDSIPATINGKQPARLADGEFVIPADVVSHLGNGSSDAGAKRLYAMMDKVRVARTGKKKQAPAVKTDKYMPA